MKRRWLTRCSFGGRGGQELQVNTEEQWKRLILKTGDWSFGTHSGSTPGYHISARPMLYPLHFCCYWCYCNPSLLHLSPFFSFAKGFFLIFFSFLTFHSLFIGFGNWGCHTFQFNRQERTEREKSQSRTKELKLLKIPKLV